MKICPLITQTSILDDKELLVRELDDVEPVNDGTRTAPGSEDKIFINPSSKQRAEESFVDEIASVVPVRFLAKSYRGRVECLGELCRFHDDNLHTCRINHLIAGEAARGEDAMAGVRAELEKAWESQRKSGNELFDLMKEMRERNETSVTELRTGVERKLDDLASFMRAASEEKQKAIEAISLTLDAKTDEIERKIDSGEQLFQTFRDEVSGWKGALAKNLETIETGLGEHRKLVRELSDNHAGIMNLVEDQKKSIEEEEKKRRTTEARMLNNAGVMAYHNGQYEKALGLFGKAIDLDPAMTETYNNLGLTYTEINEEEKATEAFKKAISLNPELAAAYNNLGYVFYRLGSYQEAIEMYNEAIGRSNDSSSAYTNLGNAYYKLEKIEDAIEAWKKALALDPANEKARRNLKRFHAEVK
ncbi:MAG: tetratricopeptide repeat protein [Candidatus Krumholzibacteriia bacterium]